MCREKSAFRMGQELWHSKNKRCYCMTTASNGMIICFWGNGTKSATVHLRRIKYLTAATERSFGAANRDINGRLRSIRGLWAGQVARTARGENGFRMRARWRVNFRVWPPSGTRQKMQSSPPIRCRPGRTERCGGAVNGDTNGRRRSTREQEAAAVRCAPTARCKPERTIWPPLIRNLQSSGIRKETEHCSPALSVPAAAGGCGGSAIRATSGSRRSSPGARAGMAVRSVPERGLFPGKTTLPAGSRKLQLSGTPRATE